MSDLNEKKSEFGCIRFHHSPFSKFASEAGNQGCMSVDGSIHQNAHDAADKTIDLYLHSFIEQHGKDMPTEFYILLRQLMQLALLHALYVSAGRQVFQFTPSIVNDFKRTDLSETPIGKLSLPYAAGFLHFGLQDSLSIDDYWRSEIEYVDGAYFHCDPDGNLMIQLTLTRKNGEWSKIPGPSFFIDKVWLNLPAHEAVNNALDMDYKEGMVGFDDDAVNQAFKEWDSNVRPVVHAALSLVLNALFYLDGYGADTEAVVQDEAPSQLRESYEKACISKKPKAIRNARNALLSEGFSIVRLCGIKATKSDQDHEEVGGGSVRPHWRRGHWRMQPCGPQLSLVKRVWVRPAFIGKESAGEIKAHQYIVEKAD